MAQELLLEKLEGLASKAKLVEGEKAEAVARIQELERDVDELKELIAVAESKVDEMLKNESAPDLSKEPSTRKAQTTLPSLALEELQDVKRRFPRAFGTE